MNLRLRFMALLALAAGYAFFYWTATTAFAAPGGITPAYRYLLVLVGVPLFLAAHGIALTWWGAARRVEKGAITSPNLVGRHTALEVLLTWLAVCAVLVCLYYVSPSNDLRAWYPRFFLILTVVFAATLDRALVFVGGMMPFMLSLSGLAFWNFDRNSLLVWNPALEPIGALALLTLDFALFLWAVRIARRSGVFGTPLFKADGAPARAGGWISGLIRTTQGDHSESGYNLQLSCIGKGAGGTASSSEVLWTGQMRVDGELSKGRRPQVEIPVQLPLPQHGEAAEGIFEAGARWMLRVQSALPEADFRATFEIPVLAGQAAGGRSAGATMRQPNRAAGTSYAVATAAGKAQFRFAEQWNSSSELVAAAACLFWVQLIWLTTRAPLGWEGWAMFGAGVTVLGWVIAPWLVKTTVTIGDSAMRITNERLFIRTRHQVLKSAVRRIRIERGKLRSGAAASLQYYRLVVECDDGREVRVGRHLRDRVTARRAAVEMEAAICQMGSAEAVSAPAGEVVRMPAAPKPSPAPQRVPAAPGQLVPFRLPDAPEPNFTTPDDAIPAVDNVPEPQFVYESA